jgi:carboxyl-terminal processing protease
MRDTDSEAKGAPLRALRNIVLILLGLILVGLVYLAGVATGAGMTSAGFFRSDQRPMPQISGTGPEEPEEIEVDFDTFWEAWVIVEDRFYYEIPDEEERVYGAIQGMLYSLGDPYTSFVPPDVARILREDTSGAFEGIGAYVEEAPSGGVHIVRVFEDAPARKAGLRAGDLVVAADGVDIRGMILNEALLLIRGPAGTEVTLTVLREGEPEPLEITITRAKIDVPTTESRMLEDNIGYVALFDFNAQAGKRLEEAIEELLDQGAEALILDLRNNPGGFLDQAIKVSDLFLPKGVVLLQRDVDGNETEHKSGNGDLAEDIPLVILINGNSASAAEIVAGAVQDLGRGTLIGETTFGKGSVQLLYDLSDGSQLRITYANWYTPKGTSLSEQGVSPDITVETPVEPTETDIQLERAVEFLTTGQ